MWKPSPHTVPAKPYFLGLSTQCKGRKLDWSLEIQVPLTDKLLVNVTLDKSVNLLGSFPYLHEKL